MNKTKTTLYIIILLITALALFGFVKFSDGLFEIDAKVDSARSLEELQNNVATADCTLFWIGEIPPAIESSGITINRVPQSMINERTLPFRFIEIVREEMRDEYVDTYLSLEEGFCPPNPFIIINGVDDLTEEDYRLIIRSLQESDAILYVFGDNAVRVCRDNMFLETNFGEQFWSFKYSFAEGPNSGVIDGKGSKTLNDSNTLSAFYNELLTEIEVVEPVIESDEN